ncbi:MAG: FecR domain-containing protein [Pseudomonadota bacterium]
MTIQEHRIQEQEFPDDMRLQALEWRVLQSSEDMTLADKMEFQAWLEADPRHPRAFDRATTVWSAYGTLDHEKVEEHLFRLSWQDRLRETLATASSARFRTPSLKIAALAAAAVIAILVLPRLLLEQAADPLLADMHMAAHTTPRGQVKDITLPDGSHVTLGPASRIEVTMSATARDITLDSGSAVFDVAPDAQRPFIVAAQRFKARAIGTVFDMRNNAGIVRLSVSEGMVDVTHPLMQDGIAFSMLNKERLIAGERIIATSDDGLSDKSPFREGTFASWKTNRLRYVGAPLTELIADANRYSARPIRIDDARNTLADLQVSFSFDGSDIDGMLSALPDIFPVSVDRHGKDEIVIRSKTTK